MHARSSAPQNAIRRSPGRNTMPPRQSSSALARRRVERVLNRIRQITRPRQLGPERHYGPARYGIGIVLVKPMPEVLGTLGGGVVDVA